ncbi:MAG: T9SS type A sorting domain-containing protein [Gilvibacter sp.]
MKKITFIFCAMFLLGASYAHAQTTVNTSNNPNPGAPSTVDMERLLELSSNTTVRVPTGTTVLDYVQDAFAGVDLEPMLTSIGFTVTHDESAAGGLDVLISSTAWDLVILQVNNNNLTPAEVTAIGDYLTGGGKLIMQYWDLDQDPTLQAIVGVDNTIDFTFPLDVFVWEAADPIFTTPNVVTGLTIIGDNAGNDNGDRLNPAAGGVALAGFVATTTANEAAIVEANGGNSYYHGFAGADMDLASWLNLIENETEFLFTLGVDDNIIEGFTYYPNPTTSTITLSALDNIERIAIYNVLGQQVMTQKINAITSQINLSTLAAGTYVMSVTVNGQMGRYKLVKK